MIFLDETDPMSSPMKAKGVGELGICGVGAAVANAIYNATGVRVRDYPDHARQAARPAAGGGMSRDPARMAFDRALVRPDRARGGMDRHGDDRKLDLMPNLIVGTRGRCGWLAGSDDDGVPRASW